MAGVWSSVGVERRWQAVALPSVFRHIAGLRRSGEWYRSGAIAATRDATRHSSCSGSSAGSSAGSSRISGSVGRIGAANVGSQSG